MNARVIGSGLIGGLVFMLGACSPPAPQDPPPEQTAASTPAAAIPSKTVNYACTPSKNIVTTYDNSDPANPKAVLAIDGVIYELYSVVSASGARYATEQGILPEHGMQWHSKAEKAVLMTMTLDHTAKPEDEKILFDCTELVFR